MLHTFGFLTKDNIHILIAMSHFVSVYNKFPVQCSAMVTDGCWRIERAGKQESDFTGISRCALTAVLLLRMVAQVVAVSGVHSDHSLPRLFQLYFHCNSCQDFGGPIRYTRRLGKCINQQSG